MYRNVDFLVFVQRLVARFKGTRRIPLWQSALAVSTALALLVSLLWVIPWQGQPDGSRMGSQATSVQDSSHTAEEAAQPTPQPFASPTAASAVPGQIPDASTAYGEDALQNPVPQLEKRETSGAAPVPQDHTPGLSEESAEVLDTQAIQEFVTQLEDAARSTPGEYLDTKAMDNLLARLESSEKAMVPTAPRSKVAKKKGAKSRPRVAPGRGTPGSAPPPQSNPVPLRPVLASQFPDTPKPVPEVLP